MEAINEYKSYLYKLNLSSLHLIAFLTSMALENQQHAEAIVKLVETRILEVSSLICIYI